MKKLFAFVGALYVGMAAWIVPVVGIGFMLDMLLGKVPWLGAVFLVFLVLGTGVGIWTYGWILQRLEQ